MQIDLASAGLILDNAINLSTTENESTDGYMLLDDAIIDYTDFAYASLQYTTPI